MTNATSKDHLRIMTVIAVVGVITAVMGVLAYANAVRDRKMREDIAQLDRELKLLQLAKERARV